MAKIILITGGTRSGKSDYAERRAESLPGPHCYIATSRITDKEMAERIAEHQKRRDEKLWQTVEEPVDVNAALSSGADFSTYLVDCITLWISNVMESHHTSGRDCCEDDIRDLSDRVIRSAKNASGTVIFVTNEVGMGIVPDNRVARLYRDLVGRCNRMLADAADEVVLVTCGLPLTLKYKIDT